MSRQSRFQHVAILAAFVLSWSAGSAFAVTDKTSAPVRNQANAAALGQSVLSPKQRGEMAGQFIQKWGGYVQRVYDVPVRVWAKRMVPSFVAADSSNFRLALQRDTFEGAISQLSGTGHKLSDAQVIDRFAMAGGRLSKVGSKTLGSVDNDLTFTAITPCRIADTRVAGGAIAANSARNFYAVAVAAGADFTSQGGSATDCNVAGIGASAVVVNVTAVTPATAGFATVYRFGDTRPLAASVNYTAGAIVNNSVIVGIPNPLTASDFSIYTFAQSHYVVDIVGYFAPPQATALECVSSGVLLGNIIAANSRQSFNAASCPAGFKATTPFCLSDTDDVNLIGSGYFANDPSTTTFCRFHNKTASPQTVFSSSVCCRVPGR